jgi:serine O-acetyltransferase
MALRERLINAQDPDERSRLLAEYKALMHQFGSSIHHDAVFAGPPFFPHGLYGVFISRGAEIGRDCIIFHQVTIGSNMVLGSKGFGFPKLGNNVYLGAGAKVIGNVSVGNNVLIGANATVVRDVPDNSVVISSASRVLQRESVDARYFSKHAELGWAYYDNGGWVRDLSAEELRLLSGAEQ